MKARKRNTSGTSYLRIMEKHIQTRPENFRNGFREKCLKTILSQMSSGPLTRQLQQELRLERSLTGLQQRCPTSLADRQTWHHQTRQIWPQGKCSQRIITQDPTSTLGLGSMAWVQHLMEWPFMEALSH